MRGGIVKLILFYSNLVCTIDPQANAETLKE